MQAICDFVHNHIVFGYPNARSTRTAWEAFQERKGVCRDFAHLAIKKDCIYMSRSEKGVQSPSETLASRRSSCRDFAVLIMEAARSLGFAARFVSGYIFIPSAGTSRTVGGGSTHAWMQACLPGSGWIDFDPTNSIVGNRNLIRVVVAWEPSQVLPLWGTFIECVASTVFRTNNSFYGFVEVPD